MLLLVKIVLCQPSHTFLSCSMDMEVAAESLMSLAPMATDPITAAPDVAALMELANICSGVLIC